MKIEYKILWFEDQFEDITATVEAVENLLDDFGFKADIEKVEVVTPGVVSELSEKLSGYNPYDLILFDYQLGKDGRADGMDVAISLRQHLYSDMIFYSASPRSELRKLLYDQNVEGVFTAGRYTFSEDVDPIIEDQIKRISDVNMMRGIVMDEVSRFDRLLRELCLKYLEKDEKYRDLGEIKLRRRFEKQAKKLLKKSTTIDCPIEQYSNVQKTNFDLVRRGLSDFLKLDGEKELSSALSEEGMLNELQNLRNRLAHIEGNLDTAGVMTLVDNESESFDFGRFIQIRKNLREASALINEKLNMVGVV